MRHKYDTRGFVLARTSAGEANTLVTILTRDLGVVRVRAQGLRRSGAKLAAALPTLAESDLVLVRGKEGWRLTGAVLGENWFTRLGGAEPRERAGRVAGLLLRLSPGEAPDSSAYPIVAAFLRALAAEPASEHDALEIAAALALLAAFGFDDGAHLAADPFSPAQRADIARARTAYVARVNRGIAASGL